MEITKILVDSPSMASHLGMSSGAYEYISEKYMQRSIDCDCFDCLTDHARRTPRKAPTFLNEKKPANGKKEELSTDRFIDTRRRGRHVIREIMRELSPDRDIDCELM